MSGRKQGLAYQLYGFIPKILNGKHIALCKFCNRTLKNTAATRLHKHRNSCLSRKGVSKVNLPSNLDNDKLTEKTVTDGEFEAVPDCDINYNNEHLKREFSLSIDDEIHDKGDAIDILSTIESQEQHTFQITEYAKNDLLKPLKNCTKIAKTGNVKAKQSPKKRPSKNQPASVNAQIKNIHNYNKNNDEEEEIILESVPNDFNGIPQQQFRKQLAKLETMYYDKKAEYFTQLIEQTKMKKTLMLLELQKLQLEIQALNET